MFLGMLLSGKNRSMSAVSQTVKVDNIFVTDSDLLSLS